MKVPTHTSLDNSATGYQSTPKSQNSVHWTTYAGFWVGTISAIAAIVFGTISMTAKCPQTGQPLWKKGKGKRPIATASMQAGAEVPAAVRGKLR